MSEELFASRASGTLIFDLGYDETGNFFNRVNGETLVKSGPGVVIEEDAQYGLVARFNTAYVMSPTALGTSLKNKNWAASIRMKSIDNPMKNTLSVLCFGTNQLYYNGCCFTPYGFVAANPAGTAWAQTYINPLSLPSDQTAWIDVLLTKKESMTAVSRDGMAPTYVSMPSLNSFYEDAPNGIVVGGNPFPPSNTASCAIASVQVYIED